MPNINYIASAGTGKTYSLVSNLIHKITEEDVSLKEILILTFTEKAAAEIKRRISQEINIKLLDEKTDQRKKIKLHRETIFLSNSYIGTFHSVFLRILRRFPHISGIDSSYKIIDNTEPFLIEMFERFIEKDFEKNPKEWEEIVKLFEGNPSKLMKIFSSLYNQRLKLTKIEIKNEELDSIEREIISLKKEMERWIDVLSNEYPQLLKYPVVFHHTVYQLKQHLKNPSSLKLKDKLIKRQLRKATSKEKEYFNNVVKPIFEEYRFLEIEKNILQTGERLNLLAQDYNGKVILKKFYQFWEFVETLKKEEKIIDFNDILEKTALLIKNKTVIEQLKSNFRYIFVDEFQDTDIMQGEILKRISNNNLYIFGDPKQCIYTWRDADLQQYFDFLKETEFEDKILQTNYRSGKQLVEFFNNLVDNENFLSHIDKKFKKSVVSSKSFDKEEIKLYQITTEKVSIEKEADLTLQLIGKFLQEGYQFKDITVLFYKNKDLHFFREHFIKKGIPVSGSSDSNLFETKEVQTVINILKFIYNREDKFALLNIVKSPLLSVSDKDIFDKKDNLLSLDYPLINLIKKIIQEKDSLSLREIIDKIYGKTDLLQTFALTKKGTMAVENLNKFRNIAYKLDREGYSIYYFLSYVEIGYEKEAENTGENSVQLLTMHRSKGLQNRVIIIPLVNKEPDKIRLREIHIINKKPAINIGNAVSKEIKIYEEELKQQIKDENERLFYVAVTRAEEKLFFITSGKKNSKNSFINIISSVNIQTEKIDPTEEEVCLPTTKHPDNVLTMIKNSEEIEKRGKELLSHKKLERFVSVSKLIEEDKKENSSVKGNEIAIYVGVLIHTVLEKINLNSFSLKDAEETAQTLSSSVPEEFRESVLSQVMKLLEKYPNSQIDNELKTADILFKEFPFTIKEDDRFIEGRIDLIYQKGKTIYVMDFKTNRYETEEEKAKIINQYEKQKEYYLKAVSKLFPNKNIVFRLGLLWKGEVI